MTRSSTAPSPQYQEKFCQETTREESVGANSCSPGTLANGIHVPSDFHDADSVPVVEANPSEWKAMLGDESVGVRLTQSQDLGYFVHC